MTMLILTAVALLCLLTDKDTTEGMTVSYTVSPNVPVRINLTCSSGAWIHVTDYRYENSSQSSPLSKTLLHASCVGQQTCLPVQTFQTSGAINISYECVETQRFGICDSSVQGAEYTGQIHLHSHSYPVSQSFDRRCSCTIEGYGLDATVYELKIDSPPATFTYQTDGRNNNVFPTGAVYDYDLMANHVTNMTLSYNDGGRDRQQLWIRVQAPGRMEVSCLRSPPNPQLSSSNPPSTVIPISITRGATETTTTTTSTSTTTTTMTMTTAVTLISTPPVSIVPPATSATPSPTSTARTAATTTTLSSFQSSLPSASPTFEAPQNTITLPVILIISGLAFLVLVLLAVVIGVCLKYKRRNRRLEMATDGPVHFQASSPPPRGGSSIPDYLHLVNTNHEYSQLQDEGRRQTSVHDYSQLHVYETFQPE